MLCWIWLVWVMWTLGQAWCFCLPIFVFYCSNYILFDNQIRFTKTAMSRQGHTCLQTTNILKRIDLSYPTSVYGTAYKYKYRQYYTLLEQKAIILIFISIIDINVNLSKNEIDKKINLSWLKYQSTPLYIVAYVCT